MAVARFQSVLMDEDSLIVSYDPVRGEPRGKGKKREAGPDGRPLGDCVDCFACVRTCPTGIDIRDGLQMECVACTQCIDACDAIMLKVGKPPGLIRYTSEHELAGVKTRVLRPRTALYGLFLAALLTGFTVLLASRDAYEVTTGRAAGAPFVELPDGTVANRLVFRLRNRTPDDATLTLAAEAPAGAAVRVVGVPAVAVPSHAHVRVEAFVVVPRAAFGGRPQVEGRFALRFDSADPAADVVEAVAFPLLGPSR